MDRAVLPRRVQRGAQQRGVRGAVADAGERGHQPVGAVQLHDARPDGPRPGPLHGPLRAARALQVREPELPPRQAALHQAVGAQQQRPARERHAHHPLRGVGRRHAHLPRGRGAEREGAAEPARAGPGRAAGERRGRGRHLPREGRARGGPQDDPQRALARLQGHAALAHEQGHRGRREDRGHGAGRVPGAAALHLHGRGAQRATGRVEHGQHQHHAAAAGCRGLLRPGAPSASMRAAAVRGHERGDRREHAGHCGHAPGGAAQGDLPGLHRQQPLAGDEHRELPRARQALAVPLQRSAQGGSGDHRVGAQEPLGRHRRGRPPSAAARAAIAALEMSAAKLRACVLGHWMPDPRGVLVSAVCKQQVTSVLRERAGRMSSPPRQLRGTGRGSSQATQAQVGIAGCSRCAKLGLDEAVDLAAVLLQHALDHAVVVHGALVTLQGPRVVVVIVVVVA
mmetsp:Transcript_3960/g.14069  ORF Transcript_3960/g.14069 Transcript_3960/m.14069 type:complete len:454 (-) Transcript_3960:953-2314(-)